MKTLTTFILAGALALLAQPNQLDLRQDPPTAVQSNRVSSAYTGTSGATTYYYWVVTRYPIGFIVPTAPVIVGGAAALGGGNSVALGWPAMTGASSYDVLRTTTNAAPSSCTCAVVLATTGTTLTDNGGALSAWPPGGLVSAGVAQAELQINNRDAGAPYITMAVRNAQRILNYQLGILKNGTAPSYVPPGFVQPYSNAQGALACVDSTGADCMATRPGPTNYCADVGAVNAFACNLSPAIMAYVVGNSYRFQAATANTGPPTVNFNGLGAVEIKKAVGGVTTALAANDIRPGQLVDVAYDANGNMQMQSAPGNGLDADGNFVVPGALLIGTTLLLPDGAPKTATMFDGADIGAKVNAAVASFGASPACGVVQLPIGFWEYSTTIAFADRTGCVLQGMGNTASILTYTGSGKAISFGHSIDGAKARLQDFQLVCSGCTDAGIYLLNAAKVDIIKVEVTGFPANKGAVHITSTGATNSPMVLLLSTDIENNAGTGLLLDGNGGGTAQITLLNSRVNGNGQYGVHAVSSSGENTVHILSSVVEGNTLGNVRFENVTVGSILNSHFENSTGNTTVPILITGTATTGLTIKGNAIYADATSPYCVSFDGAVSHTGITVDSNRCHLAVSGYYLNKVVGGTIGPNSGVTSVVYGTGAAGVVENDGGALWLDKRRLPIINALRKSNDLTASAWETTATRTAGQTAPDGTSTAISLATPDTDYALKQDDITVVPGTQMTFSWWAKNNGGAGANYLVYNKTTPGNIATASYIGSIADWTRVSVTFVVPAGCTTIAVYPVYDFGTRQDVFLWQPQLNEGGAVLPYQATK